MLKEDKKKDKGKGRIVSGLFESETGTYRDPWEDIKSVFSGWGSKPKSPIIDKTIGTGAGGVY